MLVAAVLLASSPLGVGATGVGSAAVSAANSHLPFLQPDRPMGAGFTAHAPYTFIE
jgi:hypothetical protein